MLYYSGMIRHLGNVDDRNTTTDFLELEAQRKITIQSAAISFKWPPKEECLPGIEPKIINLIDTPGHGDFRFEVDRCMPILDGAVCILDAVKGVETHTERVWASAHQFKIPRILFVNKLDRDGASFKNSVLDVATRLQSHPLVCQIPWWKGEDFIGVIDVINRVGLKFSSTGELTKVDVEKSFSQNFPALADEVERARSQLVEELADRDEKLMEMFIEDENSITAIHIKESIRRLVCNGEGAVVPVFAGASRKNMGVQPLLDAVVDYLPSPQDRPEVVVISGKQQYPLSQALDYVSKNSKKAQAHQHKIIGALASVFKVVDDPDRGPLSYVRVYYGNLPKRASMWNTNIHQFEKPLNMFQVAASKTYDIPHLMSGQIGALTGLKNSRTGDTLITFPSREAPESVRSIQIRPPEIPPAVAVLAIEPFGQADATALEGVLARLTKEDPSVRWAKDEKTEQYLVYGMGKLHLEIVEHRLRTHYKVPKSVEFKGVQVEYRETVTSPVGPHRVEYERTVANKSGKAACSATIEPLHSHHNHTTLSESCTDRDGNFIDISIPLPEDGSRLPFDPEEKRQQLLNGAIAALSRGPRRGVAMSNCVVTITYDPSTDFFGEVSGAHIVNAAIHAVRNALKLAHSQGSVGILEPVMKVDIFCPEDVWGTIQHDLQSARGGVVLEINDPNSEKDVLDGGIDPTKVYVPPDPYEMVHSLADRRKGTVRMLQVVARAPLKEMLAYDETLRGMTQGRHSIHMELDTWERVTGARERALDEGGF
jgi:elongation factor G